MLTTRIKIMLTIAAAGIIAFPHLLAATQNDSAETYKKPPQHYIRNCVYLNSYITPQRNLQNKNLENYQFTQSGLGFYIPFFTKDYYKNDSATIANLHLLAVGNSAISSPRFTGLLNTHRFNKTSIGFRLIYNDGKKSVWFFNASPFVVYDNFDKTSGSWRYASILIYNRTVNEKFSYRIGFVKTFMFGNRNRIPLIGVRFGPLDGTYVSIQLPRNISLNFPLGKHLYGSVFVKPTGGLYNMINNDSLYSGNDKIIQFGRYELLNGIRLDYSTNNISFYMGCGITKRSYIALASTSYDKNKKGTVKPFYREEIGSAAFVETGINIKFGNVKKVYNNLNMYDVFDMNNRLDPGDNNTTITNNEIPVKGSDADLKNIQYKDVQDLIELEDIY